MDASRAASAAACAVSALVSAVSAPVLAVAALLAEILAAEAELATEATLLAALIALLAAAASDEAAAEAEEAEESGQVQRGTTDGAGRTHPSLKPPLRESQDVPNVDHRQPSTKRTTDERSDDDEAPASHKRGRTQAKVARDLRTSHRRRRLGDEVEQPEEVEVEVEAPMSRGRKTIFSFGNTDDASSSPPSREPPPRESQVLATSIDRVDSVAEVGAPASAQPRQGGGDKFDQILQMIMQQQQQQQQMMMQQQQQQQQMMTMLLSRFMPQPPVYMMPHQIPVPPPANNGAPQMHPHMFPFSPNQHWPSPFNPGMNPNPNANAPMAPPPSSEETDHELEKKK